MSNGNVLDLWISGHHNHLSNLLDAKRHVLLVLDNWYFLCNFHGLHNLGILDVVQQHIVHAWPVSLSTYAGVLPPTAADYSAPCLPHVLWF